MYQEEINRIAKHYQDGVAKLGQYLTFNELSELDLHPALLRYISGEIDFLIFDDREKLLHNSVFNYSTEKIKYYFSLISAEIRKEKRFSSEYISKLILHGVSFNIHYLVNPNRILTKFVFESESKKSSKEIEQILNYVYFYEHLPRLVNAVLHKKKLAAFSVSEFQALVKKIDDLAKEDYRTTLLEGAIKSMNEFFNIGLEKARGIPVKALKLFLKEKELTDEINSLESAHPDEEEYVHANSLLKLFGLEPDILDYDREEKEIRESMAAIRGETGTGEEEEEVNIEQFIEEEIEEKFEEKTDDKQEEVVETEMESDIETETEAEAETEVETETGESLTTDAETTPADAVDEELHEQTVEFNISDESKEEPHEAEAASTETVQANDFVKEESGKLEEDEINKGEFEESYMDEVGLDETDVNEADIKGNDAVDNYADAESETQELDYTETLDEPVPEAVNDTNNDLGDEAIVEQPEGNSENLSEAEAGESEVEFESEAENGDEENITEDESELMEETPEEDIEELILDEGDEFELVEEETSDEKQDEALDEKTESEENGFVEELFPEEENKQEEQAQDEEESIEFEIGMNEDGSKDNENEDDMDYAPEITDDNSFTDFNSTKDEKKIDVAKLIENKYMAHIIETVFDYDMQEFTALIDELSDCEDYQAAEKVLGSFFEKYKIDPHSKEGETFTGIIKDYFNQE